MSKYVDNFLSRFQVRQRDFQVILKHKNGTDFVMDAGRFENIGYSNIRPNSEVLIVVASPRTTVSKFSEDFCKGCPLNGDEQSGIYKNPKRRVRFRTSTNHVNEVTCTGLGNRNPHYGPGAWKTAHVNTLGGFETNTKYPDKRRKRGTVIEIMGKMQCAK